ncbi:glutaredoxin-domain-containing protein [Acaromyces ingoldii]|uniref:Glutaredoxin-domain-containing protein n=1 Tax=Acaromyces ingoldii TaxID=215250 RepID=A0A316YYE3_9BASI|nr:glutaredoxin-domain-containing protein [Acaromyces ingoldii]PWN94122.1 glutaredoxin-domain-containing protein [Acaromyces ingoldii]
MYLDDHVAWLTKQHQQSPLTVFSKSYCPYSRRAKELLREQHAKFDVYEVDLRADAEHLQMALREISGHRTFPTIFLKDELIGGSDSLQHLQDLGVLPGMLAAAKALL